MPSSNSPSSPHELKGMAFFKSVPFLKFPQVRLPFSWKRFISCRTYIIIPCSPILLSNPKDTGVPCGVEQSEMQEWTSTEAESEDLGATQIPV